ncbi:MAG: hypothetical protein RL033_3971 [Pseudomonadota bacterium]
MTKPNTDTHDEALTDNELSQIQGGNTTPGQNRHGGAAAVEREINEYLATHPIFPTALPSPILFELPRPAIDLGTLLVAKK